MMDRTRGLAKGLAGTPGTPGTNGPHVIQGPWVLAAYLKNSREW